MYGRVGSRSSSSDGTGPWAVEYQRKRYEYGPSTDPLLVEAQRAHLDTNTVTGILEDIEFQHLPVQAPRQCFYRVEILDAGGVAAFDLDFEAVP